VIYSVRVHKILLPVLLLAVTACTSSRVVDRTADGTPILLCGPQPDSASLARTHRFHGIKTVVNLRGENEGKTWFEEERRGVEAIGANWVHIRTSGSEAPDDETVQRFFEVVENPENWPVFIHCQSGFHRTGLMGALYRRQYQQWDADRAIEEMDRNGFEIGRRDRSAVKDYVRTFTPDPERSIPR